MSTVESRAKHAEEQRRYRQRHPAKAYSTVLKWREAEKKWKYEVWKRIMQLPSYGLIADNKDNPMLSREQVIEALDGPKPKQSGLGEGFC